MSSHEPTHPLADSGVTMRSDSEQYGEDVLTSSPSSSSPVVLYKPPTMWSLIRGTAINLVLPFINGMMLGFGELFAHEAAFRAHPIGPGIEIREKPRARASLDDLTSLE
ncbi:hypothetical protein SLS62_002938 [Diatrype stigma]|uniref:Mitochondrial import protein 1 n=1 Tax=Diatrype stigma TaxID=117547 RepID=A0AAN9V7U5_9PEZI